MMIITPQIRLGILQVLDRNGVEYAEVTVKGNDLTVRIINPSLADPHKFDQQHVSTQLNTTIAEIDQNWTSQFLSPVCTDDANTD